MESKPESDAIRRSFVIFTRAVSVLLPHKLPKTVTVTMLLLFGPETLLCGTFLCI